MAWTNPAVIPAGSPVTESWQQTVIVDNLNETAPAKATAANDIFRASAANAIARIATGLVGGNVANWKHVPKAADESVATSTTFQDDDDLVLAVLANEIWIIEYHLVMVSPTAADFKFQITVPTAGVGNGHAAGENAAGTFGFNYFTEASSVSLRSQSGTAEPLPVIQFVYTGDANAGNVTLQWAQNAASGTTTLKKGSFMRALNIT